MQKLTAELFHTYYKDVYNYLYSLSHDALLSEDLTAEVFLEVVRSITSFRGESDTRTWLFSIARHRWFAWLRRKSRRVQPAALADYSDLPGPDLEEALYHRLLAGRIHELLAEEPPQTQEIVLMRLEGYSFFEIGQRFHISENSARVIDFRAKNRIKKKMQKEGFDDV